MPTIQEKNIRFTFPDTWRVSQYDRWPFYWNQFKDCCRGNKAVDFLALDPDRTLWLIEVKDFRLHPRSKEVDLCEEIALKVRDTLAGLLAAKHADAYDEQRLAAEAVCCRKLRVVFHLEQPASNSRLFPRPFEIANVEQKLKQLLTPIDPHPKVTEIATMRNLAWQTRSIQAGEEQP